MIYLHGCWVKLHNGWQQRVVKNNKLLTSIWIDFDCNLGCKAFVVYADLSESSVNNSVPVVWAQTRFSAVVVILQPHPSNPWKWKKKKIKDRKEKEKPKLTKHKQVNPVTKLWKLNCSHYTFNGVDSVRSELKYSFSFPRPICFPSLLTESRSPWHSSRLKVSELVREGERERKKGEINYDAGLLGSYLSKQPTGSYFCRELRGLVTKGVIWIPFICVPALMEARTS